MSSDMKNDLPQGWVLCESKSVPGKSYYFNIKSGESLWTRPEEHAKHKKKKEKQEKNKQTQELDRRKLKRKSSPRGGEGCSGDKTVPQKKIKASTSKTPTKTRTVQVTIIDKKKQKRLRNFSQDETDNYQSPQPSTTKTQAHNSTSGPNSASKRMSALRAQLHTEVEKDDCTRNKVPRIEDKSRLSPKPPKTKTEEKSPQNVNETKTSINQTNSPNHDSFQSIPSPSQFLAANKILSSIKAQLPEEYTNKRSFKDTFADIEERICNQTAEYPTVKHPETPPQFNEASKLVSAIKSKLEYKSPKEIPETNSYSSANSRLQALRKSLNDEVVDDRSKHFLNLSDSALYVKETHSNLNFNQRTDSIEKMEVEEIVQLPERYEHSENVNRSVGLIEQDLVMVVDTNVFIHELDVIKNVVNSSLKGYSQKPTLLVPKRVINELDMLKDNNNGTGAVCKRARAAMHYLYKSLPENQRIRGQPLRDANSHIYPCELPDDEILNCCLQQAERGKAVILLSNDKNLCNKAIINDVKSMSIADLKLLLETRNKASSLPELESDLVHYKQCLYQLLSNILENEMRAKFNSLWQHVLFKAPPWTLLDVLDCLLKHWIAVFSEVFPRIEHLINDLKGILSDIEKGSKQLIQDQILRFKDLTLEVASKCQIIPEYMDLARGTVERLNRKTDDDRLVNEPHGEMRVIEAFENVWRVYSSYGAKVASSLGINHNLEDELPNTETIEQLHNKLPEISKQINAFMLALNNVLNAQDNANSDDYIRGLELAFNNSVMSLDISRINILLFCNKCGNMVQEAYAKFLQLSELVELCGRTLVS